MESLDRKVQLAETETSICGCALNRSVAHEVLSHCRSEEPLAVMLWHERDGETCGECSQTSSKTSNMTEGDQLLSEHSECLGASVNTVCESSKNDPCSSSVVPALQMSWEADRSW